MSTTARRRRHAMAGAVAALSVMTAILVITGPAVAQPKKSTDFYVSMGDSYAVGYQPGQGATAGYTNYVARQAHLTLANFGCAGATTASISESVGCALTLPDTPGAIAYPTTTQSAAAEAFIRAHRGHIGLITVSIGGNDVTTCAAQADPIPCVTDAVGSLQANVTSLATALRAAVGPKVPIIGLTYPDVILGDYVYPSRPATPARISVAKLSVVAFQSFINPALTKAYRSAEGVLVDVTAATGAYIALSRTVKLRPYGTLPVAAADVCTLTWICKVGDIHATTKGYTRIAKLVTARLASLRKV